jgi:hypothetical protein
MLLFAFRVSKACFSKLCHDTKSHDSALKNTYEIKKVILLIYFFSDLIPSQGREFTSCYLLL